MRAETIAAVFGDGVAVIERAARRLGGPMAGGGARLGADGRFGRFAIGVDQAQRLLEGEQHLDRAHDDALERVAADGRQTGRLRRRLHIGWKAVEIEGIARQRPEQIGAATLDARMQRCGMRHMDFLEHVFVIA